MLLAVVGTVFALSAIYQLVYLTAEMLNFPYWETWALAALCVSGWGMTISAVCILGLTRPDDGWIALALCAAVVLGTHVAIPSGLMLIEELFDFSFM